MEPVERIISCPDISNHFHEEFCFGISKQTPPLSDRSLYYCCAGSRRPNDKDTYHSRHPYEGHAPCHKSVTSIFNWPTYKSVKSARTRYKLTLRPDPTEHAMAADECNRPADYRRGDRTRARRETGQDQHDEYQKQVRRKYPNGARLPA